MRQKTRLSTSWAVSPAVSSLIVLPPAVGGFWLFQSDSNSFHKWDFSLDSAYLVWSIWIGVAFAIWFAIGVRLLGTVRQLRGLFVPDRPAIPVLGLFGIYAAYAVVAIAIPFRQGSVPPAVNEGDFREHIWVVVAVGLIAVAPTVVTIWLVADRLRQLRTLLRRADTLGSPGDRIDELRQLWQYSLIALAALSIALSVAVFTINGVRALAVIVDKDQTDKLFPSWMMLLSGFLLTTAFALVYVPTLLAWRGCARQLVDTIYATPATGRPDESWAEGRARLMRFLGLEVGLMKRLSDAFLVLAPLAVSLFAVLAKKS